MKQVFSSENHTTPRPLPTSVITEDTARDLRPLSSAHSEFILNETTLVFEKKRELIQGSDGLGWNNMVAALTRSQPLEDFVPANSSLFFAVPLENMPLAIETEGRIHQAEMPADSHGIIAPGVSYTVELQRPGTFFYLFIKNEILVNVADEIFGKRLDDVDMFSPLQETDKGLQSLLHSCRHMLNESHDSSFRSDYIAQAIVAQFYTKHTQLRDVPRVMDSRVPLSQGQMKRVNDYLQAHLHGTFQIADLAASIGLSRTVFFERFVHTMKYTPNQYLQILRVNRAKQLLHDRKLSLVDVAFACGYADQSHLSRFFKRFVGVSPGKYRADLLGFSVDMQG